MSEEKNFLSRWARRKNEHRQENASAIETAQKPASEIPQIPPEALSVEPLSPAGVAEKPVAPAVPAPSMADVASLTKDSDFAPFVAKNATQMVKNAALKKLFSDPHFNIMDRLDIYIDDYSQPDPLPDGWLEKLEHAKGWLTPTDAQRAAAQQATEQADLVVSEIAQEVSPESAQGTAQSPSVEDQDLTDPPSDSESVSKS